MLLQTSYFNRDFVFFFIKMSSLPLVYFLFHMHFPEKLQFMYPLAGILIGNDLDIWRKFAVLFHMCWLLCPTNTLEHSYSEKVSRFKIPGWNWSKRSCLSSPSLTWHLYKDMGKTFVQGTPNYSSRH